MTKFKVVQEDGSGEFKEPFDTIEEAENHKEHAEAELGIEAEIIEVESDDSEERPESVGGEVVAEHSNDIETSENAAQDEIAEAYAESGNRVDEYSTPTLREDPIGYLKAINTEFVNTIKGKEAISKRGFRYIQAELNITTESEVVGWVDDPYGVVVWARAELPDGRSAEAHGEGYPSEGGVDKSEFVRYADSRAKNRAISDLTSAGALAVDELQGGME